MADVNSWTRPTAPSGTSGKQNIIQGITPETWFSPLQPLPDFAPQEVAGRQWDYPVGYNVLLTPRPQAKVTFKQIRDLVAKCDIMSIIINNRKDQTESRQWVIKNKVDKTTKKPSKISAKPDERITMLMDFFAMPDKVNTWDQWLRPLLDDLFVIDAPAVYVRRNRGGQIFGLEVMDGGTVSLNIDQNGRRPLPPNPAFKQILKGVPATSYTTDELLYVPRNMKSWGVYGCSPVESTMITINAAINRAIFNQNYYQEGNVPAAVASLPDNFTPAQARDFTDWWDSMYAGNMAEKRKVKFVPGMKAFEQLKDPEMKNAYDDYIARVLCFALGISPQPFISSMNRATAEVSKVSTDEEGKAPIFNWIRNLINKIIQSPQFFNMPDLEFEWEEEENTDPVQQATTLTTYISKATMTINESREIIGLDPYPHPAADELGVITATGFVTLDQQAEQNDAKIEQMKQPKVMAGVGGSGANQGESSSTSPPNKPKPTAAKKDEDSDDLKKKSRKTLTSLKRKSIVDAQKVLVPAIHKVLRKQASSVKKQLEEKLAKTEILHDLFKANTIDINLDDLEGLDDVVREQLQSIANESGNIQLASLGLSDDGITGQLDARIVAWVDERGAQLVSMVQDSTKTELQRIISQGLEDNIGRSGIIDEIMGTTDEGSYVFSEDRATLIATTELGNANSQGSLLGMKEAEAAGVKVLKYSDPTGEECPICEENANAGSIPLDEEFPSGDLAPLFHPRCECVLGSQTTD